MLDYAGIKQEKYDSLPIAQYGVCLRLGAVSTG